MSKRGRDILLEGIPEQAEVTAQVEPAEELPEQAETRRRFPEIEPVPAPTPEIQAMMDAATTLEAEADSIEAKMRPGGGGVDNPAEAAARMIEARQQAKAKRQEAATATLDLARIVLTQEAQRVIGGPANVLVTEDTLHAAQQVVAIAGIAAKHHIPLPVRYINAEQDGVHTVAFKAGADAAKSRRGGGGGKSLSWTNGDETLKSKQLWLRVVPNVPEGWLAKHQGSLKQSAYGQLLQALIAESHIAVQGWKRA